MAVESKLSLRTVRLVLQDYNRHGCQTAAVFGSRQTGWYRPKQVNEICDQEKDHELSEVRQAG